MRKDLNWERVRDEVYRRDKTCRLLSILTEESKKRLIDNSCGLHKIIDCAHVFGKGSFIKLKYVPRNVILLNRYSHSMLDQQKDPISGKSITKKEHEEWWRILIGDSLYYELKELAIGRKNAK
jgi:hypothetical protein